jgi:SAM-dependent methyltransferase
MSMPDVDFRRERAWWDAKANKEELDRSDEHINRALRWREIERHLAGVRTILEVGGASGVFSISLARRGYAVTHLDFSPAMLAIAKGKAQTGPALRFVQANAVALPFPDRSFDLVLNMDGAISFSGSRAEESLIESCRVAGRTLIVTVSHRAALIPDLVGSSLRVTGRLAPPVEAMLKYGQWHQAQFPGNEQLTRGATQNYFGTLRAFLPDELRVLIEGTGMHVLRCGGLGSLACLCGREAVELATREKAVLEDLIEACDYYDRQILPDGPGTDERAGLIAVAER